MAVGDVQIALPNGPTPTFKEIVGQDAVQPKAVNASFDGSGAAGPFLPCLVITGKEGFEVARIPAPQIAAGASAEVSWFPRVAAPASSGGDYVFVAAANEHYNGGHHDADFFGIPQDGRHLVIEGIAYVQGDLVIQLNGGLLGQSRSVSETTLDNNGALSTVLSGVSGAGAFVVVPAIGAFAGGVQTNPARFIIDIPYYNAAIGHTAGKRQNRSVHVKAWSFEDSRPVQPVNAWKKIETAGIWDTGPTIQPTPAITEVKLLDSFGTGGVVASLYKAM